MNNSSISPQGFIKAILVAVISLVATPRLLAQSGDTVYADVVAIDQPFMLNRLGAAQPTGMMFALRRDVVSKPRKGYSGSSGELTAGNVQLRAGKRPRPMVLRANVGDVMIIRFQNLLTPYSPNGTVNPYNTNLPGSITQLDIIKGVAGNVQMTRSAGLHIKGMEAATSITDDGSLNGNNPSSLVAPGGTIVYNLLVPEEGTFMLYSTAADIDNHQKLLGAQLANGLFGSLNVEPPGAEWYRSQASESDLDKAISGYNQIDGSSIFPIEKRLVGNIYDASNTYPVIDYDAKYSDGTPILKMYKQLGKHRRELIYTDLTAIITGANHGMFSKANPSPSFDDVWASPDRREPYREFSIHYHEVPYAVQAFPIFYTENLSDSLGKGGNVKTNQTLSSGQDEFAINYGTGGIGAEVYANRLGVGPMAKCADCAYEEFFLSAWAVGDPAMVVDIPANADGTSTDAANTTLQNQFLAFEYTKGVPCTLDKHNSPDTSNNGYKAKKVLYPDDPSNVYHSYVNDHCKFRVTHAGMGIPHVHHQHAQQWLESPNADDSHYMDSRTITPGSSYTLEMVHGGSGNLNKTIGDMIFHCHFYPHFAAGMWSMWRVHDVLELGTKLDAEGKAADGARALPDAEIGKGTPIPGLVPLPTIAMAPVPGKATIVNGQVVVKDALRTPGFPFFIPGIAGSRPPAPPLDFAKDTIYYPDGTKGFGDQNGGLPRGVVLKANVAFQQQTSTDWTKMIDSIQYLELPEGGTALERLEMAATSVRKHATLKPDGSRGVFLLNGQPPVAGAPYADPRINEDGDTVGTKRIYKAAVIQLDAVFNKKGWHYPQQRMESLWEDVAANISGVKAPEPLYIRANSEQDYVEFWHTNLVPQYYELDDYQVRTPTDIIGQHIHLVKFDVTSSDGAANGFNYEDGTLSPDAVRERIHTINQGGKRYKYRPNPGNPINKVSQDDAIAAPLVATLPNPIWGAAPSGQDWSGAQTTIQRWYADPLLNEKRIDRTLTTVFTHDHFGPSTHQQIGLYAGLLIEPKGSTWKESSTGTLMGTRKDGGPTGWQANITASDGKTSYREFMLEFQDQTQAYLPGSKGSIKRTYPVNPHSLHFKDSVKAYNDTARGWMDPAYVIAKSGNGVELITSGGNGTYSLNYRNEPIPLRVSYTIKKGTVDGKRDTIVQAHDSLGDLAYSFKSMQRADAAFNTQPKGGSQINPDSASHANSFKYPVLPIGPDMHPTDPYTPLLRAYENDSVQIRTLVGAHVTTHFFNVHGANWLFEPTYYNSGYRSTQNTGLSEHFEMNFRLPSTKKDRADSSFTDYLYDASSDMNGLNAGLWGLMRVYDTKQPTLTKLPDNNIDRKPENTQRCGCPENSGHRFYDVTAINLNSLPSSNRNDTLWYNQYSPSSGYYDNTAIIYLLTSDLEKLKNPVKYPDYVIEPLVLRARAGECINVTLRNAIDSAKMLYAAKTATYTSVGPLGKNIVLTTSTTAGLHAELVSYDVRKYDGSNAGFNNRQQTAGPGETVKYEWYAGNWKGDIATPVEFGSIALSSPDPLVQPSTGLIGALIIEPLGSNVEEDPNSHWSATVKDDATNNVLFREFVLQFQDNLSVRVTPKKNPASIMAINYKSEPLTNTAERITGQTVYDAAVIDSYTSVQSYNGRYPVTPHMYAAPGQPMRIRLINSGGSGTGEQFNLHGHVWQQEPYKDNGRVLGYNRESQWLGYRDQLGALNSFDVLINSAGGKNKVPGDYFYNSSNNLTFGGNKNIEGGMWGILTVATNWREQQAKDLATQAGVIKKAKGKASKKAAPVKEKSEPEDFNRGAKHMTERANKW